MEKGVLIGKGMTAEVYEWGRDRVLKLYFKRFGDEWIKHEAKVGAAIHAAGVPSPAVYEIVDIDDRKGIIFQRIFGKSILKHIEAEPWKIYYYAQRLANLQFGIHQRSAKGLPTQKDRFAARISSSSRLLGKKVEQILRYMESLPEGNSVCHGDLHFNNIIESGNRLVPIDWNSAYQGNPLGDVARTCLMMNSPALPPLTPRIMVAPAQYTKWLVYLNYLNEYMKLAKVKFENVDAWILPVAAAKLRDKVPGEEKWLLDTIHERVDRLDT